MTLLYLRINNRVIVLNYEIETGGEDMSFKFLKYVAASLFLMAGFSISTHAAEINQGAFSGNINTTVSSGFSMRVQERDCLMIDGYKYSEAETTDAAVIAGIISR